MSVSKKRSREESPALSDFSGFDGVAEVKVNIISKESSDDKNAVDESSEESIKSSGDDSGDDGLYVDNEDSEDEEEDSEGEDEDEDEEEEDEDEDKKKRYKRTMKYIYSTDEESS